MDGEVRKRNIFPNVKKKWLKVIFQQKNYLNHTSNTKAQGNVEWFRIKDCLFDTNQQVVHINKPLKPLESAEI